MIIYTNELPFEYELEKLTRLFFPFERVEFSYSNPDFKQELFAVAQFKEENGKKILITSAGFNGKVANRRTFFEDVISLDPNKDKDLERALAVELFECYCEITEYTPAQELSDDEIRKTIISLYFKNIEFTLYKISRS